MRTILVTGFEPFGGESVNPSWEVVKRRDNAIIDDCRVVAHELPCVFGESLTVLNAAIDALHPVLVLAVGQAGGRSDITVERVAINVNDARIPDNSGQQPVDAPVIEGGPAAWFSTLPVKAMVAAIREAGIPASVSQTAGTFVCNHVMYGLLNKLGRATDVKGGFIHIPYLPEQAAAHPGAPSMAADTVLHALETAIVTALRVDNDIRVTGGATH